MDPIPLTKGEIRRLRKHIGKMQWLIGFITVMIPITFAAWCYADGVKWGRDLAFCAGMNFFVILPFCAFYFGLWDAKRQDEFKVVTDIGHVRRPRWQRRLAFETRGKETKKWMLSPYHFIDPALYRKVKNLGHDDTVRLTILPDAKIVLDLKIISVKPL